MAKEYFLTDRFAYRKEYNNFTLVNSLENEYGYDEKLFYTKLLRLEKLSEFFNVSVDDVIEKIKSCLNEKINLSSLFSYQYKEHKDGELIADNAIKVADNAAYYYERYWSKGYQLRREILCDAYIVAGIYINIVLHPVFMELFQTKYPSLFDKEKYPFLFREEDLFSDAQKESLSKLSLKSELKCFDYSLDNLSLELVYKALKDREIINSKKYVSNVAVYFDEKYLFDYVFIHLFEVKLYNKMAGKLYSYNRVLYVPLEFFKTKDWSLVENVEKHGEPYKNENMPSGIEFITEKQGNAGYFNTDLVKKIKEVLLAL